MGDIKTKAAELTVLPAFIAAVVDAGLEGEEGDTNNEFANGDKYMPS